MMAHRVGEAKNPGPPECNIQEGIPFVLGTANVDGMQQRISTALALPQGLWGFTETHLTSAGIAAVTAQAKAAARRDGRLLRVCAGAPAPPRVRDATAGSWSGVMFFADCPTQRLQVNWRGSEYENGRTLLTVSYIDSMPVMGATIYGAAKSPSHQDPLGITSEALQTCTEELVDGASGPRFIQGDFNTNAYELPQMHYWHAKGWRELQLVAQELWHQPLQPTSKHVAIRDYIWASPELLMMLQSVEVHPHIMPNHSVLYGRFLGPTSMQLLRVWHRPLSLPWADIHCDSWHAAVQKTHDPFVWPDDTTTAFETWSHGVEASLTGHVQQAAGQLPRGCRGRGRKNPRTISLAQLPISKAARPGEPMLQNSLCSRVVQQWYKQLRRLGALLHGVRNGASTAGSATYQCLCWRAIKRAPGFQGGFVHWWSLRPVKLQGSCEALPDCCPGRVQLELIYDDFLLNFRRFESWHLRKRTQYLQVKKETEHKDLFRSLKPEPKETLDILYTNEVYSIEAIDSTTGAVQLDRAPRLGLGTFRLFAESILPRAVDDQLTGSDWILFDSDTLPVPGQDVVQTIPLTAPADIFAELEKLWLPRWQGHDDLTDGDWRRILAFNHHYLPRLELSAPSLGSEDVKRILGSSHGLRTKGPDGWARIDLLSMPDCYLTDVARLFDEVEKGKDWPLQLIHGHVTSLEKVQQARYANEFRPIVLYSLMYRIWGSLRSRHLLQQLERFADFPAYGFLHGRHCQQLTYQVLCMIERSLAADELACGVVAAIEKCFNHLPRAPLLALAAKLGIPPGVICGWKNFLCHMRRSFRVHAQYSDAHFSSAGLPEGDSMSCLGMCLASFSFHYYMRFFVADIRTLSFVDNVELLCDHVGKLVTGHVAMETWMEMMRLRLDNKKTMWWATNPLARQILQAQGFKVVEAAGDLGISMCYGARHLNKQMQDRILSVMPFWNKLRSLKASAWHKLLAIRQALLPRALHGCSHIFIGQQWFKKLRTGIMRSMHCSRAGASPLIRLNMIFPIDVDPGFYDLLVSFRDFHRQLQRSQELRNWWAAYRNQADRRTHGPFGKLLILLAMLKHIDSSGQFIPWHGISISFWSMDFEHLRMWLEYAWRQLMARTVATRKDFAGLDGINFEASFVKRTELDRAQSALLACIQDGTFHLDSTKSKFDASCTGHCVHCGEEDTLSHRALDCDFFYPVRQQFLDCTSLWSSLPVVTTHHGLVPENEYQIPFWRCLSQLDALQCDWQSVPGDDGVQYVFTDGSCRFPETRALALSGWFIVNSNTGRPIGSGILPSSFQSINRAELFAVIMTIRWARHFHCRVCILSDSQYVIRQCLEIKSTKALCPDLENFDLWTMFFDCWHPIQDCVTFEHVSAHQDPLLQPTEELAWKAQWNNCADTGAKTAALNGGGSELHQVHQLLCDTHQRQRALAQRFQSFLLALALHRLSWGTTSTERPEPADLTDDDNFSDVALSVQRDSVLAELIPIDWKTALSSNPSLAVFGKAFPRAFITWLLKLDVSSSVFSVVTVLEVFAGFDLLIGWNENQHATLAAKLRNFEYALRLIFAALQYDPGWTTATKPDIGILMSLPAFSCPWPQEIATRVNFSLRGYNARRAIRTAADLSRHW